MFCGKYDLQGVHAGIYLARKADGSFGYYERLSKAWRKTHTLCITVALQILGYERRMRPDAIATLCSSVTALML